MSFFALKISDPLSVDLVKDIKSGSKNFVVNQLNQLESDLKNGSFVFIQLGGDKVSWDKGLIGLAEIIKEPFDKGYDKESARNFRLGLKMILVLNSVIKREEFKFYVNAYDAGGIGPNTKGEQNQAIKALTDIQACTIIRAMVDKQHELEEKIRSVFGQETCDTIFGKIPFLVEKNVSYSDSRKAEEESLSLYEEKSLEERKAVFSEWMLKQYKSNGELYKDRSAKNYSSSLKNDASKLSDYEGENKNLFYYTYVTEFATVMDEIKQSKDYFDVNDKGNGTFSAAMKMYCSFLVNLATPGGEDEIEEEDTNSASSCLDIKLNPRTRKLYPLDFIVYGAPGTGKTYSTPQYAVEIIEYRKCDMDEDHAKILEKYKNYMKAGQIVFTTFHQNYGYEEFIQGLRPDPEAENLSFKPIDGCFKRIADNALRHPEKDFVIIIDEINRANISKVFGELITLIEDDKRWGEKNEMCVTLQSGDVFAVPNNLYIIGTMNSADKSISLIDAALRRRFEFIEQRPDKDLIADTDLKNVFEKLNEHLAEKLKSSDLLIGHSYFMNNSISELPELLNNKVIPLLYEYFYDQKDKVKNAIIYALTGYENQIAIKDDKVGRIRVEKTV